MFMKKRKVESDKERFLASSSSLCVHVYIADAAVIVVFVEEKQGSTFAVNWNSLKEVTDTPILTVSYWHPFWKPRLVPACRWRVWFSLPVLGKAAKASLPLPCFVLFCFVLFFVFFSSFSRSFKDTNDNLTKNKIWKHKSTNLTVLTPSFLLLHFNELIHWIKMQTALT